MALGKDAVEQLRQELEGGYNLNASLLELLRRPLDWRGQKVAVEMIQGLSQVLKVSLFMLNPGDSSTAGEVRTAPCPKATTHGGTGKHTPAKDKRISGEQVTPAPLTKSRGQKVTREEITSSPYKDGSQWRKYGQKNIRNRIFARYYYKCMYSHERGCRAKKQVQQQDNSSDHRPMFLITYVNEHTCQQLHPTENISTTNTTARNDHFDPPQHVGTSTELENKIMAKCLANVVIGRAAAPSSWSSPASSMLPPPPVEENMGEMMEIYSYFLCGPPFPPASAWA
ncbi:probable WRKY transcription factor 70 [Brachypodium distachyon]|uniref:probable WRKY transcription factor 70 n=1 Tax=Brachypodium distachyon TaxID=15368 RepID=UPI0001C72E14|nr:probable WRKY transcription factor 70 [Brachypodium distachyon]|eukprot:XP_024314630.1 probable WRKY transcription factor 70 [Brachypodium distachyon]